MEKTSVKKNGILKCNKNKINYFSQIYSKETITIPDYMADIEKIESIIIEPKIISFRVISTMEGKSDEGQYLSGCKLLVEIELKQKILYIADTSTQSVHVIENVMLKSAYIIVPKYIEGTEMDILIKENRFNVVIYVEDITVKKVSPRKIFSNVFLLVEGVYRPTYQICFSEKCRKGSNISICYDNGKHLTKILNKKNAKNILPKWSPTGQEIAYLFYSDKGFMINIYNVNTCKFKKLTEHKKFDCVTSFCWNNNGDKIYFAASVKNKKEIYVVNTRSLECMQLTHGNDTAKSYKPKCSYDGKRIAYIKTLLNLKDLYIIDINGLKSQKITDCGFVQDFDWSKDNRIAYIENNYLGKLFINIINTETLERSNVKIPNGIISLKKIKFSPQGNYITYIGNNFSTQNIFLYDIYRNITINLTRNIDNIIISDYAWKIDEKKIFYSANNLGFYNIYSLDLENDSIIQITNSTSSYMEISYRPRIL